MSLLPLHCAVAPWGGTMVGGQCRMCWWPPVLLPHQAQQPGPAEGMVGLLLLVKLWGAGAWGVTATAPQPVRGDASWLCSESGAQRGVGVQRGAQTDYLCFASASGPRVAGAGLE